MRQTADAVDSGSIWKAREPTVLARLTRIAGRLRPTNHAAKWALRALLNAGYVPRYTMGLVNGRRIALDLSEMIDQKIFLYGAFDERGLALMRVVMEAIDCRTVLDIGANVGNHTASFCDAARHVHAFEPNPSVFQRLKQFVERNRIDNVTLYDCGLSDKNGELTFYIVPGCSHLATFEQRLNSISAGQVKIAIGDDIVRDHSIEHVDFIKLDVEGHEFEVLRGLANTIARDRPVIVMEYEEKSLRKFADMGLEGCLPDYIIHGTYRTLASRLFKSRLGLEKLVAGKEYSHILCIPKEHVDQLARSLSLSP